MKKSEMIELLADVMELNFDGDNGSWYANAESVLAAAEVAGMLPPSYQHPTLVRDAGMMPADVNEWEPE